MTVEMQMVKVWILVIKKRIVNSWKTIPCLCDEFQLCDLALVITDEF